MARAAVLIALVLGSWAIPVASLQTDRQPEALTRLREALGGESALSAVRTIRARGTTDRKPHKDHVEIKTELPGRFFRTVRYVNVPALSRRTATESALREPGLRSAEVLDPIGGEEPGVTMGGFDGLTPLPSNSRYENALPPDLSPLRLSGLYVRFVEFVLPLIGNTSSVYPVSTSSDGNSIVFRGNGPRWWQIDLDPATDLPMRMSWTTTVLAGATVSKVARPAPQPTYWQVNSASSRQSAAFGGPIAWSRAVTVRWMRTSRSTATS